MKHRIKRTFSISFGWALFASIFAHVGAGFIVITVIDQANAQTALGREIRHEDPPPLPPPPKSEVPLGVEESQANTLTFIGYEEYEKHLARLSEVEQAAMRAEMAGGTPTQSQPPTEETPQNPEKTPPEPAKKPEPSPPPPLPVAKPAAESPPASETPAEPKKKPEPEPEPEPETPTKPEIPPTPETPPTPEPTPAPPAPPAPPEPGNPADKDAEATSIVSVPQNLWRQGKPLAAQGLDLKTRRPNIPTVTWLTMRPSHHPLVEILFMGNGKPKSARVIQSSGDQELDGYINDSLYRWRASGKRLKELKGEETVTIRLKLLLN